MKKFTLLILLLVFAVGYGQSTVKTNGVNNPIHYDKQSKKLVDVENFSPLSVSNINNQWQNNPIIYETPQTLNKAASLSQNEVTFKGSSATDIGNNNILPKKQTVELQSQKPNIWNRGVNFPYSIEEQEEVLAEKAYKANFPSSPSLPVVVLNRNPQALIVPSAGATESFAVATGDFFYDPTDGVNGGPGGDCTTTSSGDPGDYPNCGCVTTTTLTGTGLSVEFLSFNIFGNFDILTIYDGPNTSSPQIYNSNLNGTTDTLAGMIAANGSAVFTSTSDALTFAFTATTVVNSCGWEVEVLSAGGGGGGGVCANPVIEVNQDFTNACMANISQGGLAQSYIPTEAESAGAGIMFTDVSNGLDVDLSLWDGLPNAGGTMLASGTTQTDGTNWADVFWDPAVNVTVGNTYYIVIDGDTTLPCIAGSLSDVYPDGNVFANNYSPFPQFDYTFRTYSCDSGGGGGVACSQDNPENNFENGYTTSSNQAQRIAMDITVPADTDFTLNTATVDIWMNPGSTVVSSDITFFSDAGGAPGAVMGTQSAIVPTSQTVIGNNFGFDISEVVFDITPEMLAGQAGTETTYWISFNVTITSGSGFISSTTATIEGFECYFSPDSGVTWIVIAGNDIVYNFEGDCEPIGGGGVACSQSIPENNFENGYTTSSDQAQRIAMDITVPADTDFTLNTATVDIWMNPGSTVVSSDITFFSDAGGAPGAVMGTQSAVVPTSQTVIGNNFGFDISEVVFDITPEMLAGQAGTETTYWISFNVTVTSGSGFISSTTATIEGFECYFSPDSGVTWIVIAGNDIVYNFEGICDPIGGGGGNCTSTAYDSTAVPFDIDGSGTTTVDCANAPNLIPITVADAGTIGAGAILENITIDIAHTWTSDLDLYLVSPNGTELLLANDLGGGIDDGYNGTMFEDGGADITVASAPFGVGPYQPMGGTFAAAFDGEDITGDWNLKLCDDAGGDTGQVLQFSMSICVPPVVSYDDCENAIALACGDSVTGETLTATDSGGNPAPDVFYKFTGTGSPQSVTISLCGGGTDYDSLLRVFDDCDLLNQLAVNDDSCGLQSEVTFFSDGTSTYYIMVEGFSSNAGNFSLDVTCIDPPANDECGGAIAVSCGDSITGTTIGATVDTDVAGDCGTALTSPGVWYSLADTSGLPGTITLSLCNGTDFDSKLSVYTGDCSAPPLTCVTGNDDACGLQSEVTFSTDGNTTFLILVHSFGGATGNFTLDVSCSPTPPPNDMIVNSIDVDEIGFPYTDPSVAMPAATTEDGNPQGCDLTGANGVWYNFVAAGDGTAIATIVTPGGASSVTFYTAPDEEAVETDLVLVDQQSNQCAPGTSSSIFTLAGQAYYVFVLNTGSITDIVIDGTNLGVGDNAIEGFSYYPNPTTGVLNLSSVDNIEQVSVYNLLGQRVLDRRVEATASQLDISGLSSGTYLMEVTVNGQRGTYRVLKN